jgi:hypothetical protein
MGAFPLRPVKLNYIISFAQEIISFVETVTYFLTQEMLIPIFTAPCNYVHYAAETKRKSRAITITDEWH